MLAEQFRAIALNTGRMREILQDPIFAAAIVCLKDECPVIDAEGDAVNSVRSLSFLSGYNNAIESLLELAQPLPAQPPEEEPTWGVEKE